MKEVRAIIAGSRSYYNPKNKEEARTLYNKIAPILDPYSPLTIDLSLDEAKANKTKYELPKYKIIEVVSGTAKGIDLLGEDWAIHNWVPLKQFPANWEKYDLSAGPIRNKQMADYADVLFAFWDMRSNGTRNMINQMKSLNKPFYVFDLNNI